FVVVDGLSRGSEARTESGEVERAGALVDLNRVSAAHSDVGLGFALEIGEFAARAGATIGIPLDVDRLEAARPDVARNKTTVERVFSAGKKFEGFGRFK